MVRPRTLGRWALGVAAVGLGLLALDLARLVAPIDHVAIDVPTDQPGTTWLLLGSDTRDVEVAEPMRAAFGSEAEVPGARADVVVLLHEADGRRTATAIPRDLLAEGADGRLRRIAVLFGDGPQAVVDAVCGTLGVAVDHVAVLDAEGFVALADAVGPVRLHLENPRRDVHSGLDLPWAGDVDLDGAQLLALVRSRQGEELVDGRWAPTADGGLDRATAAVEVLAGLQSAAAAAGHDPLALHDLAGTAARHLTVDDGASLVDLLRLGRMGGGAEVGVLPTASAGGELSVVAAPEAPATLAAAGHDLGCRRAAITR